MRGTLYVCKISDAKKINDSAALKIFGVRLAKFLPGGWVHRENNAPSKELLFKIKGIDKNSGLTSEHFQKEYVPYYLKEMKIRSDAQEGFKEIVESLESGRDVYYACYCKHKHLCHRGIMESIFKKKGYNVKEM